ncbi:MAG: hypothetical protein M1832_004863 [Thelocarpon impressellum]|nr:MAG: hypothetical protein M1832_004863 [Thelocarpon impressellum]
MTPPPNTSTGSLETNGNSARGVVRPAAARKQEASDMDDLVSDFGFLAVNATSRDFYGFTSGMSFANLVLTPATLEEIPPSPTRPLPPRHALYAMTQRYLERIFVLLPFFSETALFASINSLYHRQGSDWDHWVLYMVLATSSASLSQGKGDTHHQDALAFAATALTKAERVLHPGSVMGVQAILFLVQFAMLQPDHFDSWYLIGVASRTMVDLGLHQDQAKHATSPDTELRRRVFHCVYSLDR